MDILALILGIMAVLAMFITYNQWTRCAGRTHCVNTKILRNYFIAMMLALTSSVALIAHFAFGI